ncbi:cell envelope biogenesis protein OmpA [Streptomyces sp. NPDC085995]|uniref:cell envelope biogenesis protein OmpA n=1 Tax=Streptomyces sp. NPDC085995 TaxID=3154861 RepID=UPI0034173E89
MQPVPGQAQAHVVSLTARRQQTGTVRTPAEAGAPAGPAPARPGGPAPRRGRSAAPPGPAGADVLRIVGDSRHPVFLTVHADGRRRYGYWQPLDAGTGKGGCYVALATDACDALYEAGRIALGEPLVDATRTTYRVRAAQAPAASRSTPRRTAQRWERAA